MKRVAVVGSGISGLAVAHALASEAHVTLFEAGGHFGGHTHTVDVQLDGVTQGVDTGFLVFNERTYPNLIRLFDELNVETARAEMSFSVQVPQAGLEWSGNDLNGVFAQRRNLLRPRFLHMLTDIMRFNRLATGLAEQGAEAHLAEPIGDFLARHRFGAAFRDGYFLPMIGCNWSCPTDQMLQFPIATMIRFCHNHGLIQIANRPQWHTVRGGAKHYVQRMLPRFADARLRTPVTGVKRLPPGSGAHGVLVPGRPLRRTHSAATSASCPASPATAACRSRWPTDPPKPRSSTWPRPCTSTWSRWAWACRSSTRASSRRH